MQRRTFSCMWMRLKAGFNFYRTALIEEFKRSRGRKIVTILSALSVALTYVTLIFPFRIPLPAWSWRVWLALVVVTTVIFLILIFDAVYRYHTRTVEELKTKHQSEASEKDDEITELRTQKDLKVRRRYLRERLGELLAEGEEIKWGVLTHDVEKSRRFQPWLEQVKKFLSTEPEFDRSHRARFESTQVVALNEFIKELKD